jgi:outer membrane lipase/esterase
VNVMSKLLRGAALAAALVVAACGGGGGQVEPFEPTRILALGDETSVILSDGRKYTVNALATGGTALACETHPVWVQLVADAFELKFPQCPGTNTAPSGVMLAAAGAKAADIAAQVDSVAASFTDKDLVTMLVGANDILELYAQYPARSEADLAAELRARGRAWGVQVNRVAQAGPAVLLLTVPDMGLTPYALAQKAAFTDTDRAALLTRLTNEYNAGMRLEIINDGRLIGLAFADLELQNIVRFPAAFGFANVTDVICLASAPLPTCTTQTMVTNANATNWLWADDRHLSPGGQNRLGLIGALRAKNNPF